jgi:LacI family transcriptional regulator
MRDVAREAEVSLKTVSRVVNGEGGVTDGLATRVADAIERLGYRPDDRARGLRSGGRSSRNIGFVQVDVANPFFSSILRGLEDVARENDQLILAGSSDGDPKREEALINDFIARRVEGLVITTCHPDLEFLTDEVAVGTPVVFVDQRPPADVGDLIHTDHYGGASAATRHLVEHGHRRIAFLGDTIVFWSAAERLRGFIDVMTEAGLDTPWLINEPLSPAEWERRTAELFTETNPPTALLTAQNFVTTGAVRALHTLHLQHRVALVGFDDVEFADLVDPAISVVAQRPRYLGRLAGERLYARLAGEPRAAEPTVVEATVEPRGSGEVPPPAG